MGRSRGGWTTTIHLVAADARTAIAFARSPGQAHDAPEGRTLLPRFGRMPRPIHRLRDRAYEGDATRQRALELGYVPVAPPTHNRRTPWAYDRALSTRRHEIARLFRRRKGVRRIVSRCETLEVMCVACIHFALIVEGLR